MADVEYDFTITACDVQTLTQQIQTSTIATTLDYITLNGTDLAIFFVSALSDTDQTTLNTIVSNQTGTPFVSSFLKFSSTTSTSSNSSSFVVINSMQTSYLLSGTYLVFFRGDFSTTVPLLTTPGITIAVFNGGVQVSDSTMTTSSSNTDSFSMLTATQIVVGLNQIVDVRWMAATSAGNTMTCTSRLMYLLKQA